MTVKTIFSSATYAADLFSEFKAIFSDGTFNGLGVAAHSPNGLSVDVVAGGAIKSGMFLISDAQVNVTITPNGSGYNRIDVIAADMDNITLVAVPGTPNSAPTAPNLTGNKLALAQVFVGNGVSVINTGNITDVRIPSYQVNDLAFVQSFGIGAGAAVCVDANALSLSSASGNYNVAAGCANLPSGEVAGTLIHIGRDGRPSQIFQGYANNTFWFRSYSSGGWSTWANAMSAMPTTLPLKNAVVTGSIKTFALACADGLTAFKTTAGISDVPTSKGALDYSFGHVYGSGNYKTILITSRTTGIVHTNLTVDGSTWLGWNAYTAVAAT
jgi:hypothetical protein